ncbi:MULTISPECIES: addiction module antidote protein [Pseudomonas]|jgi:probable addiction module antidote protein|uniref:Putative addiction module antidote protein n=1 Tax=Pseudomonas syringae Cit 7 TaxID=629264 RepID=A0A8T8LVX7_PSESX|nr:MULTISPECIES: addiction module antidote protein [Pseudomonas]ELQ12248.1 transciptional regulator [Pseudomonas syringae BRIP39023]MCK9739760.1 putative addiction module antidote protein [Pseudomonas syringae pv. syringae]MCK9749579.1 putative addiction module antidote protein [Pseudomonas syringae pv. syringae]MCK9754403.1 putative addiction module antidote protein [Pseudomonas syringae pv. syringae]MCK9779822.1 putative addiction module antidote protein [Pseudomonas syringae pv. syringae]
MTEIKSTPEEMPILNLNTSGTSRYEASRFLDNPETISAYLAESMKAKDPELLMKALSEVAKAQGVNKVARDAGVNRESLYKSLKGGAKTRYDTIRKLMEAVGVELTVQPIATNSVDSGSSKQPRQAAKVASAKAAAKPKLVREGTTGKANNGQRAAKSTVASA